MTHARPFLPALLFLLFTAGAAADVAAQKALSADEKELAAYTLTMPTVRKMAAATKAIAQEMARDPKVMERDKLKARLDVLQAKDEVSDAEAAEIEKLAARVEALEEEIDKADIADDNATLADMEATIKKHPGAMRALAAAGITARDYALSMMALLQAAMIEGFSQGKADLTDLPPGVNPANVRFVREHKVELEAIQKEMAGIGKKDR
jgi:hypothetical protein